MKESLALPKGTKTLKRKDLNKVKQEATEKKFVHL